ncbi:hypothetical protein Ccrd_004743 [Cynara cardunculus var. scolymus]|uniref:Uncharacterized protein n=1 Tax=Cynara cardunculus var. scolymus TaxID=59895 RepID=A0A118JVK3_CYNCS|nr:hypothetical protein Ccrd_004743 [Cynara cardunculus var. scolymus]
MDDETKDTSPFDMEAMRMNLPERQGSICLYYFVYCVSIKGGLSVYYAGKSRTFECMADVHCLNDLKKQDRSVVKGRKKKLDEIVQQQVRYPCRPPSDTDLRVSPIVGL